MLRCGDVFVALARHVVVIATLMGGVASAQMYQPGPEVRAAISAYERTDYATAYTALKHLVFDPESKERQTRAVHPGFPNAWAMLYLARMMDRGLGGPKDTVAACGLLRFASSEFGTFEVDPRLGGAAAVRKETLRVCNSVSEQASAAWMNACFLQGLPDFSFTTYSGDPVVIDYGGIHVQAMNRSFHEALPSLGCYNRVVSIKHTPVSAREREAFKVRDFIEFLAWRPARQRGQVLYWCLVEIAAENIRTVASQDIGVASSPAKQAELEARARELIDVNFDGNEIRWQIHVGKPRTGSVRSPAR